MDYPPPPSLGPIRPGILDAAGVLRIASEVEAGASIDAAMAACGLRSSLHAWRVAADEGADPFWSWAVMCVEMAEQVAIALGEKRLHSYALDGDTKALTFFLAHRSKTYAPKPRDVTVTHAGTVTHDHRLAQERVDQALTSGTKSVAEIMGSLRELPDTRTIDVEGVDGPQGNLRASGADPKPHASFLKKAPIEEPS